MAIKLDAATIERIFELRERHQLTVAVIATRLGLGMRTVRLCLSNLRAEGRIGAPVRHGIYRQD